MRNELKALLAGGLVLGVGATAALAAWSDQAFVEGVFATSTFNIQVSGNGGTTWVEADQDDGADAVTLAFPLPLAEAMSPGTTIYAPAALRTSSPSAAAEVTLQGATIGTGSSDLFDALTYVVVEVPDDQCDAPGVAGGDVLVASSPLTNGSTAGAITLAADAGSVVELCFAVTLPADADDPALQGLGVTALWRFHAASTN